MSLGRGCLRLGGSTEIHQASCAPCSLKYPSIVTDNDSAKIKPPQESTSWLVTIYPQSEAGWPPTWNQWSMHSCYLWGAYFSHKWRKQWVLLPLFSDTSERDPGSVRPMAFPPVKFLFSLLVTVTVAQIVYKQNMNMSSIPEAHSASSEIHIAPHMQASECVQVQSCGLHLKNKN